MNRRDFLKNIICMGAGAVLTQELWPQAQAEAAWNADGSGVRRDAKLGLPIRETDLQFRSLENRTTTDGIVLHHIGGTNRDVSAEEVHQWHLNNGWSGIGYHFLIRKDGTIERGRPMDMLGAHCYQHNWHTIGVNVVGNFMEAVPTSAQMESAAELLAALCRFYGINPDREHIKGHREYNSTDCPGRSLYNMLDGLVEDTAELY
ncbi:N-acetylmuramoyl-L-alanine amidase [Selenomonas ruminantium]|uniref:N-acetylmuramoyl-L-alanine amidase n=1 Tax=Selenomonas ruminantium TaxID=971 RepID=A0A1I3CGS0_SELRU|nr:N-acetylmuramoyl-L-alanine amidase [Selenomonas ruminantium]